MFFHHVPPKMPGCFAREVALTTVEGLLSSVLALVFFQIPRSSARIVALITLERLFSPVGPDVPFEIAR